MKHRNMLSQALTLCNELKRNGKGETSLKFRLFAFFSLFLISILLGFLVILILTGTFSSGEKETYKWVDNELTRLNQQLADDYGKLSRQGLSFAETITYGLNDQLDKYAVEPEKLQEHPEIIDPILRSQMSSMISSLKGVRASGAFLILDATVNPSLPDAENSHAGIFLKSTEPNILNSIDPDIRSLVGSASMARDFSLQLLPQWQLEFHFADKSFFDTASDIDNAGTLPLSKLYYWSDRVLLEKNSESGMLLCMPIISEYGYVYGICGFEVSSMLFKLAYSPSNSSYPKVFAALSPSEDGNINLNKGLLAGNFYMTNTLKGENVIPQSHKPFEEFRTESGVVYGGLHRNISLYPQDSVFASEAWVTTIAMPIEDLESAASKNRSLLLMALLLLCLLSLFAAFIISRRSITPVLNTIDALKSKDLSSIQKTKYLEINDLIEFLTAHDDAETSAVSNEFTQMSAANPMQTKSSSHNDVVFVSGKDTGYRSEIPEGPNLEAYEKFVRNIKTLSSAERAVFNLYMEGYTAKEITEILYLSINTIKTHNKRIYEKLEVTSRKELMVYVQMMRSSQN